MSFSPRDPYARRLMADADRDLIALTDYAAAHPSPEADAAVKRAWAWLDETVRVYREGGTHALPEIPRRSA